MLKKLLEDFTVLWLPRARNYLWPLSIFYKNTISVIFLDFPCQSPDCLLVKFNNLSRLLATSYLLLGSMHDCCFQTTWLAQSLHWLIFIKILWRWNLWCVEKTLDIDNGILRSRLPCVLPILDNMVFDRLWWLEWLSFPFSEIAKVK